jgi:hypothetical protein
MEGLKQQHIETTDGSWAEKQETAYWKEVNESRNERMALIHLKGLSTKGLVNAIATANGYRGIDIYSDMEVQALKVETSINQFLKEIEDLNNRSEALTPMPVQ